MAVDMTWTLGAMLTEATELVGETFKETGTDDKSGNVSDETAEKGHK
jgi:hypothetical protein